ncbi:MAG TPA: hypothetical protein VGM26_17690 [Rhizomicrobium sp.]|jgi:hypothetical protein
MRLAMLAVLGLVAYALPAQAQCTLTQFTVPGLTTAYDPFLDQASPVPVGLTLQTNGVSDCSGARVELALTYAPSSPQTGSQIHLKFAGADLAASVTGPGGQNYSIGDPANAFVDSRTSYPLGRAGLLSPGPIMQIGVPSGQTVPPGSYNAELQLVAKVIDAHGEVSQSSAPFSIMVNVKPSVRVAAGSGGLLIDVGELRPGAQGGPVRFDAYSNVDYTLRLISDNDFALVRNGRGAPGEGVPYQPIVSGAPVDSSASVSNQRIRNVEFTAPGGGLRHHTFAVRILPFSGLRAGDYLDLMTVEIRARI